MRGWVRQLMTIPDTTYYSALLIASEIGEWRGSRTLTTCCLCLLDSVPPRRTLLSGGMTHHDLITKQGGDYLLGGS